MARFGFCGPSYTSQSLNADCQRTLNWYPEIIESGQGKGRIALYPTPGSDRWAQLVPGTFMRGLTTVNGRAFGATDTTFVEFTNTSPGTWVIISTIPNDNLPVSFACSAKQLLVLSAGSLSCFDLTMNTFTPIVTALPVPSMVGYSDGYFISLIKNSQKFQISALLDGTSWDPTDVFQVQVATDNLISMLVDHREVWLFGGRTTQVYYNSGDFNNPFEPIPGGFIEQGIAAQWCRDKLDNSVFWLGSDDRGQGIAWRANGYTPTRVSNHAVEYAWSQYPTIADAVSYTYQDMGHAFWVIRFPSGNATWVYDASTGMWHERDLLNPSTGVGEAHHSQYHIFCFNKHLIGDWASPNVNIMTSAIYTDLFWSPPNSLVNYVRRLRRAPHISSEQEWIFHHDLEVDFERGLGLATGQGSDPTVMLRFSNDGGKTWSNQRTESAGKMGDYIHRVHFHRLGRARDRVYEVSVSDPIPWRVIDAYLLATPGFQPQESMSSQIRKTT